MEVKVRTVSGIRDCFVALPLDIIEALQGRNRTEIYSAVLELRLSRKTNGHGPWYVAWAGAASTSSSIEVSRRLAECMDLPDGSKVQLKALADVAHAVSVELEPATEDDWEILELNAGFVEDHILSQVGVLCLGQLFPIWVQGDVALTLRVTSATPKQMVRLVPGTELIVAPKVRKRTIPSSKLATPAMEASTVKAWLRVQEIDSSLLQRIEIENLTCFVEPTVAVFLSKETAKRIPFSNGQLVVVTRSEGGWRHREYDKKETNNADKKEGDKSNGGKLVVLRAIYTDLAAEGHVMISRSLRLFLGAPVHSRIEIKNYTRVPCISNYTAILSPLTFKAAKKSPPDTRNTKNGQDEVRDPSSDRSLDSALEMENQKQMSHLLSSLNNLYHENVQYVEKKQRKEEEILFELWASCQIDIISKFAPEHCQSIPVLKENVVRFLLPTNEKMPNLINRKQSLLDGKWTKKSTGLSFLLSIDRSEESDERNVVQDELVIFDKSSLELESSVAKHDTFLTFRMGKSQIISSFSESQFDESKVPSLSSLTWLKEPAFEALERLKFLLSPKAQDACHRMGLYSPGYVLLHGPPASGKTKLCLAIARELEENPSLLCHKVMVKCSELVGEQVKVIRSALQSAIFEAFKHAPSVIILDDLDLVIPANSGSESREPSPSSNVLSEQLSDLIDTIKIQGSGNGECIAFLASSQSVSNLPTSLCTSGRFDFHIALPAPAAIERAAILSQELENRGMSCREDIITEVASKCDGYDTSDLEVLVDRAVHAAAARLLSLSKQPLKDGQVEQQYEVLKEDFLGALDGFLPVAMRDISRPSGQSGRLGWQDVGGLSETCRILQEMLELPLKYSQLFAKAPLRLRSGVLLYGPPGCGKTHVVGVAAAACSLRLISVKGPELLNKYIGASEQGVRDIFAKATAAAPCILFFDEFDAIAPKRGHDNTGVTDRVVNQLLTELDGVEALNGVFVFAATSRPDLLDAALLRPGRLDRLLLCDFPKESERLEILQVLSKKLALADDVNLGEIACQTDNFSGADLQALLSDAQLEAVHTLLAEGPSSESKSKAPVITMPVLRSVLLKARPSVSDRERRRLLDVYENFVSSRSSMSAKGRDRKGKRATLA